MIFESEIKRNKKGEIEAPISVYNPSEEVKTRTKQVMDDFYLGYQIMNKPYSEFNDMSVIERQRIDQKIFNTYVEPESNDPDESWKSTAIRPIVRNRVISIAAHVTGTLIYPQIFAQNDQDQEDKDAETVMRDLMEWVGEQSNYAQTFLYSIIAALVNPAVIIYTEFAKRNRTVKEIDEKGKWTKKEILDEVNSGFKDCIVPIDELFIGNIYEHNIQNQPFLVWRRAINYSKAKQKYGHYDKFNEFVKPGLQIIFDSATDTFYEQYDEALQERLVEEVIYYNKTEDLELVYVNGVLLCDPDQPIKRKDKNYPFAKTGYELIDEGKFFYHYSLVRKMAKDEEVVNTLYRMVIDGTYMRLMPPMAVFGDEAVNSSIVTPGTVSIFKEGSRTEKIDTASDVGAGLNLIEKIEGSISESSNDVLQSGESIQGSQTAFEISRLEQNARIMLGLFGKMVGFLVKQLGELKISDICQFLTVAEVNELVDEETRLKFATILMPNKSVNGKNKTRKIQFMNPEEMMGNEKSPLEQSFDVWHEASGGEYSPEGNRKFEMNPELEIYKVNPQLFREMKFKVIVRPDIVTPPSDNLKKALNLELYDRLVANPLANQENVLRDLLLGSYDETKNDTDKYVLKQEEIMQNQTAQMQQKGQEQPSVLNKLFGTGQTQELQKVV